MKNPAPTTSSVPMTAEMIELLNDEALVKRIGVTFPDFKSILLQTQIDITNEGNRDTVGPTILALKHLFDVLTLFSVKGKALIERDKQTKK